MINLDYEAARAAPGVLQFEAQNKEMPINQTLGILAEQGPFAMLLWALGREGNGQVGHALFATLRRLLQDVGLIAAHPTENNSKWLERFKSDVCQDFKKLVMSRQLMERTLIYARHYAKAQE